MTGVQTCALPIFPIRRGDVRPLGQDPTHQPVDELGLLGPGEPLGEDDDHPALLPEGARGLAASCAGADLDGWGARPGAAWGRWNLHAPILTSGCRVVKTRSMNFSFRVACAPSAGAGARRWRPGARRWRTGGGLSRGAGRLGADVADEYLDA